MSEVNQYFHLFTNAHKLQDLLHKKMSCLEIAINNIQNNGQKFKHFLQTELSNNCKIDSDL